MVSLNRRRSFLVLLAAIALLVLAACGSSEADDIVAGGQEQEQGQEQELEKVEVVEVYNGFSYYGACGNETVVAGTTKYYPVFAQDLGKIDQSRYPTDLSDPTVEGFAPLQRVVAPGPGDDIGLFLVYSDGLARFESDSGRVIWLTDQEQVYEWDC
ncbi:MAG: hypothetical protein ACRBK7_04135 [Acidimicrobiales bacterium]